MSLAHRLAASQWFRFLLAGGWNSLFGWAVFSALWFAANAHAGLWLISTLAHVLATTQAFFIQRHLVFRSAGHSAIAQFLRFQAAYLFQLVAGVVLITVLATQGIHPVAAQPVAMLVLAVCGFFLGRDFVFVRDAAPRRWGAAVRDAFSRHRVAVALFVLSMAAFERFWGGRFYTSTTHLGHDFTLAGLTLLEGHSWVLSNGLLRGLLDPPWFTPAWCAGGALYADPQAAFYSPLQLLAFVVDPFTAAHLNALLFAAVGFWGSYALARKVLGWTSAGAAVFGVLAAANAFMPLRSAVGEVGFQPLYLWPWLVLALCWPGGEGWRGRLAWPALSVALCLTAWLQFGFGGLMVPAFLASLALALAVVLLGRAPLGLLVARAAAGGTMAIVLNASKLYESVSFMRNFPRDFYGMPGFPSLGDALATIAFSLIQPSEWTAAFAAHRMENVRFAVLPHEWNLNFGWGALCLAIAAVAWLLVRANRAGDSKPVAPTVTPSQSLALAALAVLVAVPVLLLWSQGAVQSALKSVPILNSTAWPMRWIVIYLPLVQLLLAWPVQKLLSQQPESRRWMWGTAALLVIWSGPATEPVDYYLSPDIQSYDPQPVMLASHASRKKGPIPITSIEMTQPLYANRNDAMLYGASQGLCYNPIYGYRLESFPQLSRLREGAALERDAAGRSLLLNPACLVHPAENQCKPGDGFALDDPKQRQQAELFLARHPFEWKRPAAGIYLSWLSQFCFWLVAVLLCLRAGRALRPTARV
ncbi:MAG: GtrA family protein [Pseudomonadota bacterium]